MAHLVPDDPEVHVPAGHQIHRVVGVGLPEVDVDVLPVHPPVEKIGEGSRHIAGPGHRHVELQRRGGVGPVQRLQLVQLGGDALGVGQKLLPPGRRRHALGGPLEDGDAQLRFQVLDGPAQVGLPYKQLFGGFVDRPGFSNFNGVFQVQ